jgi:nucleoside-diphosphate-sugar epimerase
MKIFLTGGTGFIGQPLTRALLKRGWQVTALVRNPESSPAKAIQALGAKLTPGDVTGRESLRAAMAGVDLVFHNAGWYELGVVGPAREKMRAINVLGTENVLGLAVELSIPKILYTSSTTALGDTGGAVADESFQRAAPTLTVYEQTKTEAHAIALRYQQQGAPLVIVCPAQVIRPGDHSPYGWFARLYVRGWLPPAVWAPDAAFTMGHLDDVTEAMALAAEKGRPGQTYIVGGGVLSVRRMIETWSRTPGGFKPFLWMPRPLALLSGALSEPLLRFLGLPAFLSREVVRGSYVSFRYSSAKAERELGAKFRTAEQAWLDTLAAERTQLKNRA